MKPLRFIEEAKNDIKDAYAWYEKQRKGLGESYLLCVEEAVEKIRRNPDRYPVVHKEMRRLFTRRFPFGFIYLETPDEIVCMAVMHVRRDPKKWQTREAAND